MSEPARDETAAEVRALRETVERFELAVGRLLVVLERQLASNDHAKARSAKALGSTQQLLDQPLNEAMRARVRAKLAGKGR
jgi:hypothetical protein